MESAHFTVFLYNVLLNSLKIVMNIGNKNCLIFHMICSLSFIFYFIDTKNVFLSFFCNGFGFSSTVLKADLQKLKL